ncbi:MAG: hypothetical protein ACLT68_09390 [Phocaeicola coprophilus]|uniref:hypothetical protein n=1 Tax=Phocaeicola TaxID=909656 RepID=UPI003992326C
MSTVMEYEELVELLQEGKIGYLRFVLESENAQDFLDWCRTHGTDPSDESAEFYVEQTDINLMDRQVINDEDYGVWN